jgi:hypothetical protein
MKTKSLVIVISLEEYRALYIILLQVQKMQKSTIEDIPSINGFGGPFSLVDLIHTNN